MAKPISYVFGIIFWGSLSQLPTRIPPFFGICFFPVSFLSGGGGLGFLVRVKSTFERNPRDVFFRGIEVIRMVHREEIKEKCGGPSDRHGKLESWRAGNAKKHLFRAIKSYAKGMPLWGASQQGKYVPHRMNGLPSNRAPYFSRLG